MKKQLLAACLIAGTSIGAGMIALPMSLCKIGILPTIGMILGTWFFMYVTGLLGVELNLRAGQGLPLGRLARLYSGPVSASIGTLSLTLLIYAVLSAYLYGGASILQSFLAAHWGISCPLKIIILTYAGLLGLLLWTPVRLVLEINRVLLVFLLIIFAVLVWGLLDKIELSGLPLLLEHHHKATASSSRLWTSWTEIFPLLFLSYGFQAIFHTLTNFCQQDPSRLKRSLFWGTLIPAFVYITWTASALIVLYQEAPGEYDKLLKGKLDVGEFVEALSHTISWAAAPLLASVISFIAIIKSSIGVGLGLYESWAANFYDRRLKLKAVSLKIFYSVLTLSPPLVVALLVPELFLKALRFAGMILVVIAIFLPLWLIRQPKAKERTVFYPFIARPSVQFLCLIFGLFVVMCEILNLIHEMS